MVVVRRWHHWLLMLLQSLMYLLPQNHCAHRETIKITPKEWREVQALCDWNTQSKANLAVIAAGRMGELLSEPTGCIRMCPEQLTQWSLSPFQTKTQRPQTSPFPKPSHGHMLIINPCCLFHFFQTCPYSDSSLDIIWFFANSKRVPASGQLQLLFPLPGPLYMHLCPPPLLAPRRKLPLAF